MNNWIDAICLSGPVARLWLATAVVLLAMAVATGLLMQLDRRVIDGVNVWSKPFKFDLSLTLHFLTLCCVLLLVDPHMQQSGWFFSFAVVAVGATAYEVGYITLQGARQQASHFKVDTPWYRLLYALMAIGAILITLAAGLVGLLAWIEPAVPGNHIVRLGAALGMTGGALLTLWVALRMGGALTHRVGPADLDTKRMWGTGWSLSIGDRRAPHFFATHMMQIVPGFGVIVSPHVSSGVGSAVIVAFAGTYACFTWWLFREANAGVPIGHSWYKLRSLGRGVDEPE